MYQVKLATLDDLTIVAELFEQYRLFYQKTPDPQGAMNFIAARLTQNDSVILLAQREVEGVNQTSGFVQLYPTFASTSLQKMYILNDLFVAPAFRRAKIASALMAGAKQHAVATGAQSLKLCTAIDNHHAQTLYRQMGYRKVDNFDHYILSF